MGDDPVTIPWGLLNCLMSQPGLLIEAYHLYTNHFVYNKYLIKCFTCLNKGSCRHGDAQYHIVCNCVVAV